MDSQLISAKEDVTKQNQTYNYIAIPIDALDLSNQEVQSFLLQNLVVKSVPDNKFCVLEAPQNVRPSVIEYNSNPDQNEPSAQNSLPLTENNNTINNESVVQEVGKNKLQRKQLHQCNICSAKFRNQTYYQQHVELHNRKKKYKCEQCYASFNVEDNFKIHMAMHTKGEPTCPLCNRKFQRMAGLKSHLMLHQIDEVFTCNDCHLEFENEDEFNKHVRSHLKDIVNNNKLTSDGLVKRICSYCNSDFETNKEYKEHISFHIKMNRLLHNARKNKRKTDSHKDYPHKCDVCRKSFPKISLLQRHFRIHSGEKPYVCEECNRSFAQKGTLQIHKTKHTGIKPFACTLCPAKFCQKGNLRVHVEKTHTVPSPGENMYKCTFCSCIFKKIASLNGHITKTHSGKNFDDISSVLNQLKELEKQSGGQSSQNNNNNNVTSPLAYLNLVSTHDQTKGQEDQQKQPQEGKNENDFKYVTLAESISGENVRCYEVRQRKVGDVRWYMCSYCVKEFKKPSDLLRHLRVHTREKPYSCNVCKQKFSLKSTLSTHINTHILEKHYNCKICCRNFTSAKALYVHTRRHERGEISNEIYVKPTITCDICKTSGFQNEVELKKHAQSHREIVYPVVDTTDKEVDAVATKQPLLLTPQGLVPVHTFKSKKIYFTSVKPRPHVCSVCSASFSKKVHLKRHFLTHTGERKFKCEYCPKSFYTMSAMKEHVKFHFNIKNHACKICGKKFVTSAILKRHLVTHSNQKPYYCPTCKKQFKTFSLCKKHIVTHSTQRPYSCSFCEKKFKTLSFCKDHIKTHKNQVENKEVEKFVRVVVRTGEEGNNSSAPLNGITMKTNYQVLDTLNGIDNFAGTLNSSNLVATEIFPNALKQQQVDQQQMPVFLRIGNDSHENHPPSLLQLNNNVPLDNNSTIQTIFIDYDDFQTRLLPNYNFFTADFSQTKENVVQNPESGNILLSVDPVLNEINQGNGEPFLNMNLPNFDNPDLVGIQDQDACQNEPISSRNFDKSLINETVNDLVLSHPNVGLFGTDDFTDYTIQVSPSNIVTDKGAENCQITLFSIKGPNISTPPTEKDTTPQNIQNAPPSEEKQVKVEPARKKKEIIVVPSNKIKKSTNYQCPSCYRTFTKKSTFVKHQDYHRSKDQQDNKCKYCSKIFKKPSDLVRHLRTHTGERPFTCSQCEKSFSLKSTLDSHYKTHKPGGHKEFNCPVCNSYFSSKSSLKVHMLLHTGAKPYSCPTCPLKFRTTGQRQSHLKKHFKDGVKTEKVSVSKKKEILENLQATALRLEENPTTSLQNTAKSKKEEVGNQVNTIEIDSLLYQLDYEGNGYLQDDNMEGTIPISLIHLDEDNMLRIKLGPNDNNQVLNVIPDIVSANNDNNRPEVEKTNVNRSPEVGGVEFCCTICKKKLKNQKVLRKHMKIHERKKYFCDKCAKSFAFERELVEHAQVHVGVKRFPCQFCANSFNTDANLKVHMKRMHLSNAI